MVSQLFSCPSANPHGVRCPSRLYGWVRAGSLPTFSLNRRMLQTRVKSQLGTLSRDRPLPLPLCGINPRLIHFRGKTGNSADVGRDLRLSVLLSGLGSLSLGLHRAPHQFWIPLNKTESGVPQRPFTVPRRDITPASAPPQPNSTRLQLTPTDAWISGALCGVDPHPQP